MAGPLPLDSADPARLGGCELLGRLGSGGQGVVYLGRPDEQGALPPLVAVKLLHARLLGDAAARGRFVRELALLQRVAGFCTAQVLAADVAGDRPYIVSEYVPGRSLRDLVLEEGPRAGADLDRLAIGSVTALSAIHRAGVVHRDFKPQNVLLGPDGPRVIDFGVARAFATDATLTSQVVGTPAYMAPEQFAGRISPATDLFAWAATLLFAATGTDPFAGGPLPAVMYRIMHETPDLGALPGPIAEIAAACLSRDPKARPTSEAVLLHLLGDRTRPTRPRDGAPAEPRTLPYTAASPPAAPPAVGTGTVPAPAHPGVPHPGAWTPPAAGPGAAPAGVTGQGAAGFGAVPPPDHPGGPAWAPTAELTRDAEPPPHPAASAAGAPAAPHPPAPPGPWPPPQQGPPPGQAWPAQEPPPAQGWPGQGPPGQEPSGQGPSTRRTPAQGPPPAHGWPGQGSPPGQGAPAQGMPGQGPPAQGAPAHESAPGREAPAQGSAHGAAHASDGSRVPYRAVRRGAALVTGLALAALLAALDVFSLAILIARPALSRGHHGGLLPVVATSFTVIAAVTLIAVVLALRGSRPAVWTVLVARVVRVAMWGAWGALVQVSAAALTGHAVVTALVVVLLAASLRAVPATAPR